MRTLHVHLGPHKTGSTAVQKAFSAEAPFLLQEFGLSFVDHKSIKDAARLLNGPQPAEADALLSQINTLLSQSQGDIIISNEDLAGDLPGRSKKRRPYPRLWENMKAIRDSFPDFDVKFYFFHRAPEPWMKSAYAQLVKHRDRFQSEEAYREFLKCDDLWDAVLQKPRDKAPEDFNEIPYIEGADFSSPTALLECISGHAMPQGNQDFSTRSNASPDPEDLEILEVIANSRSSKHAKRIARAQVLNGHPASAGVNPDTLSLPPWPQRPPRPEWLADDLGQLWDRTSKRIHTEDQDLFLPDPFVDLSSFRKTLVQAPSEFPAGGRALMESQQKIIRYRFRTKPEVCALLGMTISYLRRDTPHTEHAAFLFQRLWEEEYPILLATLPTRWLISTVQTFMDHGATPEQRAAGTAAYFYTNILKAYEAERALDGLPPDAIYPSQTPTTPSGFGGLDRFRLGGTDLMLNTNALLLEHAAKDDRCGRVIQEFLLRLKASHSIFSRMDQSRIALDVSNKQFDNCWSFFEKPKKT